jgi:hypothetical protein
MKKYVAMSDFRELAKHSIGSSEENHKNNQSTYLAEQFT